MFFIGILAGPLRAFLQYTVDKALLLSHNNENMRIETKARIMADFTLQERSDELYTRDKINYPN